MRKSKESGDDAAGEPQGRRGLTNGLADRHHRDSGSARAASGRTNGLTNGLTNGITNGLTNGLRAAAAGLTNGRGRTNGRTNGVTNGFVNGAGAVNGFRISYQPRRMGPGPSGVRRKLMVVGVLVLIAVSIPYALVYAFPPEDVEIDGYFLDWLDAQVYEDEADSSNPDTALVSYAMRFDSRGTYFYLETQGDMLYGRDGGADGFFIFVDSDGDPATGYSVRGLGADALVEVVGWNSTVERAETFTFDPVADSEDFAGFGHWASPRVAFDGGQMEIGTSLLSTSASMVGISARHTNASDDWSEVNFLSGGTALRVVQDHDAPAVTPGLTDERMLGLTVACKGPGIWLEGLNLTFLGNATPVSLTVLQGQVAVGTGTDDHIDLPEPVRVGSGKEVQLSVIATFADDAVGSSFGLELAEARPLDLSGNATVTVRTVQTGDKVSYIAEAPSEVSIDGAFADWAYQSSVSDPLNDTEMNGTGPWSDRSIDITSTKAASGQSTALFYMSVDGTMLGGSSVPSSMVRWAEPSGAAANVTNATGPVIGSDFAFAFIDLDWNASTGFYVGGSEACVMVVGKAGRILSSGAFMYINGSWTPSGEVQAAIDSHRLEVGASFASLGLTYGASYPVTFLAQNWFGCKDTSEIALPARTSADTRTVPGVIINEIYNTGGPNDWIEFYNTAPYDIDMSGWTLWLDNGLYYTFPAGTIIPAYGFLLLYNADFGKARLYELISDDGTLEDAVMLPSVWKATSYGRTGTYPYDNWTWMDPTPLAINEGQVPIPEFGDLVIPIAIMPIMFIAIRRSKRASPRRGR